MTFTRARMFTAAAVALAMLAVWQLITPGRGKARSEGDGSQEPYQSDPEPERESPADVHSSGALLDDDGEAADLAAADPDHDDDNSGAVVEDDPATEAEREPATAPFTLDPSEPAE